jgi:hypothetical protein
LVRARIKHSNQSECACGCEGVPKTPGSRFIAGHHLRLAKYQEQARTARITQGRQPKASIKCRRCYRIRDVTPGQLRSLTTYQQDDRSYLCRKCCSHDKAKIAREKHVRMYGIDPSDSETRAEFWSGHVRAMVAGAGGIRAVNCLSIASRKRGLSEKGKERLSAGLFIAGISRRKGRYEFCPLCKKLSYVHAFREGARGLHFECYNQFRKTQAYTDWRKQLGHTKSPMFQFKLRRHSNPLSARSRNLRGPRQVEVKQRLSWLLRRLLLSQTSETLSPSCRTYSNQTTCCGSPASQLRSGAGRCRFYRRRNWTGDSRVKARSRARP